MRKKGWAGEGSNLRSRSDWVTTSSLCPVGHRPTSGRGYMAPLLRLKEMPSFDVVSEVDHQEIRNAVDQTSRELAARFDFKGTDSSVELGEDALTLRSATEDRLKA